MKMTVHQRLRAQRKAEHSRAIWRRRDPGWRCHDCADIPLSQSEKDAMSPEDWDWYPRDMAMYDEWAARGPLFPEPDDPKLWHIQHALGYWR